MMRRSCFALLATLVATQCASGSEIGYYSQPALYGDRLIFVSEGDLWTATIPEAASDSAGSAVVIAHRLTSSDGVESRPCISPDGTHVAFSAQYDGNTDVFVMPIDGGAPTRLTFHPDPDIALGWTPDGASVLFSSPRMQSLGRPELWRVGWAGSGQAVRFEFGECTMISLSQTGRRAAFTRWSNENWTWKRYRGGTAPEIWLADLAAATFTPLTEDPANDLFPMWLGERVYFLSDRTGTSNIFSDSPDKPGSDIKQHTEFAPKSENPSAIDGYDIRWPCADAKRRGTRIAFCQGGGLSLLDVANGSIRRLDVRLASDRIAARQRLADLRQTLTEFALSPDGDRLLVGSRGELMALPVDGRAPVQITFSSSAREWGATFMDGDRIVMISDAAGEQQIASTLADGSAKPSLLTSDREAWLFPPQVSPDRTWIAFADKTLRLHVLNVDTLVRQQVDQSDAGEITDYRFSPDSQWLAYSKPMPNDMSMVMIHSLRTNRSIPVSDPANLYDDREPRWDPAGKYLYFLSDRNVNPALSAFDFEHGFYDTVEIFAVPLAADVPPPLESVAAAAGFDLKKWATPPTAESKKDDLRKTPQQPKADAEAQERGEVAEVAHEGEKVDQQPAAIRVDTEGLSARQCRLPIPPGNYNRLEAIWGSILYVATPMEGLLADSWPDPPAPNGSLHRFTIVDVEDTTIARKVSRYAVSADGKAAAYPIVDASNKISSFIVIDPYAAPAADSAGAAPAGGKPDKQTKRVDLEPHRLRINIRQEWAQILSEAWRLQRDFYWAPNYVGVNWPSMKEKYLSLLPRVGDRLELNDLIGQMIGELGTSHTYIWGGEQNDNVKPIGVGMLGADIEFDGRGFRIARIVPGQPWGEDEFLSPLEAAHLGVKPGNYILAINGVQLTPNANIDDALQDRAGKMVRLTVADDPGGANARTIEVKTLKNERPLRYAAWVQANRKYVDEKSQGKLGYLHIPDMGGQGLMMFSRLFYPQFDKQGLVIDVRDNGGGFVSQMIVQRLARKPIAFDQPRHGRTARYPYRALNAHLVTLIDQHAGSDGDIFPASFRALGLGPLIGTRTWGGVVGIRGDKPFVDMGLSTQPEFAWWDTSGGWSIENEGVSPDIEIDLTPGDRVAGRDPQLDRAIEHLLGQLKEKPMDLPTPPPWPVRAK